MAILTENSTILDKTKELCQTIVDNAEYNALMGVVETFLNDDEARLLYQTVIDRSDELRHKQQAGVERGDSEVSAFKDLRGQLEKNEVITDFMAAQDELQLIQKAVSQYVGMTLEYGRVPTDEDMAAAQSGCCGGGCGGGGCG